MAEQKHLKMIKRGVSDWNLWRRENPDVIPNLDRVNLSGVNLSNANLTKAILSNSDLRGANLDGARMKMANMGMTDLSKADLGKATMWGANLGVAKLIKTDLSEAYMSGVDMHSADLRGAKLYKTDLSGAELIWAKLDEADLRQADLSFADLSFASLTNSLLSDTALIMTTLVKTNLSNSDISGAYFDAANLSEWVIKDIKCTHIYWKKKLLKFQKGEFEKVYMNIEHTIEMMLDIPFSDLSHYVGQVIEQTIDQKYGEGTILFRAHIALSNQTTKYEFINFGTNEQVRELQGTINEIKDQLKPVIEEAKAKQEQKTIIDLKEEIDIPFAKGLIVRPKEVARQLNERYVHMHPLLQKIVIAIQSAIQ